MRETAPKIIDVRRILDQKMGHRAKWVPRIIVRALSRLLHEDEINAFILKNRDKQGVEWLDEVLRYFKINLVIRGHENLPADDGQGRYTFICNHPLGGIDGISIGAIVGRKYGGRITYLVNDMLMHLPGLAPLCVPINKTGAQSRQAPRLIDECFASQKQVIMFPAGLCSRMIDGKITDLPWHKTFLTKSIASRRIIIPIHFEGANSPRFYKVADIGKRLGVKFNPAMLFLADEMFKNKGKTFVITIGKPIDPNTLDDSLTIAQKVQHYRNVVYRL